ncbi:DUF6894 family protein (plasmid) [Bradyrhizobium sp. Pa8]|uniref:DUF6894 family protein n=1 Tax=Bradyrhizobium sp. Pa8 TaxID=3386552 RepID=UPI00403F1F35
MAWPLAIENGGLSDANLEPRGAFAITAIIAARMCWLERAYFMRYVCHIETNEVLPMDRAGREFTTQLEADDYGARVASEVGMDAGDYSDCLVTVADETGKEIARHPVYRDLSS